MCAHCISFVASPLPSALQYTHNHTQYTRMLPAHHTHTHIQFHSYASLHTPLFPHTLSIHVPSHNSLALPQHGVPHSPPHPHAPPHILMHHPTSSCTTPHPHSFLSVFPVLVICTAACTILNSHKKLRLHNTMHPIPYPMRYPLLNSPGCPVIGNVHACVQNSWHIKVPKTLRHAANTTIIAMPLRMYMMPLSCPALYRNQRT